MIIKVINSIYIDVEGEEQAEEASAAIDSDLQYNMQTFPHGDVLEVDIYHYEEVSLEEIKEKGLDEDA